MNPQLGEKKIQDRCQEDPLKNIQQKPQTKKSNKLIQTALQQNSITEKSINPIWNSWDSKLEFTQLGYVNVTSVVRLILNVTEQAYE